MILFLIAVAILQSFSISLGVGASTLAIINFFVAIADGKIDETERRMMGVVYKVLRIAMVLILVTSVLLAATEYSAYGFLGMSAFTHGVLFALFVLYVNAMLMSAHLVPSTFGPAIQAGSWYTLGTLMALKSVGISEFSFLHFILAYITWIILAIGIVNGVMSMLKSKKS